MNSYFLFDRIIEIGAFNTEDIINKLNLFFGLDELTKEEYLSLMARVNPEPPVSEEISPGSPVVLPEEAPEDVEVVLPEEAPEE